MVPMEVRVVVDFERGGLKGGGDLGGLQVSLRSDDAPARPDS